MQHDKESHDLHHFDPSKVSTIIDLVDQFSKTAVFGGGKIGRAFEILSDAKKDGAKIFCSLAGAMVPGGMRLVIGEAMKNGLIDVLVTTGANITHDLIETFGVSHLTNVSHKNDQELREKGIDRVYDSFVHQDGFPTLEDNMQTLLMEFFEEKKIDDTLITSSYELLRWLGSKITDPHSIVKIAYENKIPLFVPAIADSILGLQIWLKSQFHKIIMDEMKDLTYIQDVFAESEKSCALLVGGGVPKNYMLQASLMSTKEYEYGVAITMDRVETGGLSGATLDEAVSWGKFTWEAPKVTVYADSTIVLPILVTAWIQNQQK
ncbi:MAG: deoxyhypusine synthase family protein [Candidatus Heimdallarchaeota archaeon]|nr:deoxyhypusine synthase family protein [Candidatus Heimdallarchaeota archaeon]